MPSEKETLTATSARGLYSTFLKNLDTASNRYPPRRRQGRVHLRKMEAIMFHQRNKGAMGVYCKAADAKAVQSNGDALRRSPEVHLGFRSK